VKLQIGLEWNLYELIDSKVSCPSSLTTSNEVWQSLSVIELCCQEWSKCTADWPHGQ